MSCKLSLLLLFGLLVLILSNKEVEAARRMACLSFSSFSSSMHSNKEDRHKWKKCRQEEEEEVPTIVRSGQLLHDILVSQSLVSKKAWKMAPSCVCPRRTCFGFIEKHDSLLCLSQKILFWVHWKAWLHLVFVPEHLVLGSLESMIFFFLVHAAAGNRGFLRHPQTTQCVSCCLLPVFCRCLPIFS